MVMRCQTFNAPGCRGQASKIPFKGLCKPPVQRVVLIEKTANKLSDEMFMELSHKYEVERMELKDRIKDCRERLEKIGEIKQNKDDFIKVVRKFMEMDSLTAPMLRELIDHIDVYEKEGGKKNYTQRIVIYYRFVGFIEIPKKAEDENYKADTRVCVEVEYVPAKSA